MENSFTQSEQLLFIETLCLCAWKFLNMGNEIYLTSSKTKSKEIVMDVKFFCFVFLLFCFVFFQNLLETVVEMTSLYYVIRNVD